MLLARKHNAHPAQLSYLGFVIIDKRRALIVECKMTEAVGTDEPVEAKVMAAAVSSPHRITLGADKNYDPKGFVAERRHTARGPQHRTLSGLIERPSQACLPGLRAWAEVGWIALSQCPRAFLPQPMSI